MKLRMKLNSCLFDNSITDLQTFPLLNHVNFQIILLSFFMLYLRQKQDNLPDLIFCMLCTHRRPLQVSISPLPCLLLLLEFCLFLYKILKTFLPSPGKLQITQTWFL